MIHYVDICYDVGVIGTANRDLWGQIMGRLTSQQISSGIQFFYNYEPRPKHIVELSEYAGEQDLIINCTQLEGYNYPKYAKANERKRVLSEWCKFLTENTDAFVSLSFGTKMPQELFNAVCQQRRLESLYIKWGSYPDISEIERLHELTYLHIGSGAGVQSIMPLTKLKKLVALSVENFQKITDYSPLATLENLELLSIEGDGLSPKYIHVDSLDFLKDMKQLRSFTLMTARLESKDYSPVLELNNLEYLCLSHKVIDQIYARLSMLKKLKYGDYEKL